MIQDIDIKELRNLIATIKEIYRYDFSNYAISSFKRRILRILELYKISGVEELITKIKTNRMFLEEVIKEITVNTTEMFRDPSMWRTLRETILPQFKNNNTIRIWHAACSSGEEVYSMGILLKEAGLSEKTSIFASDINEDVLKTAKQGIYPTRTLELNMSNYERFAGIGKLSDYYKLIDNNEKYVFDKSILKNVMFRTHDLVLDESFSKFDIILCRNVMIYFNFELQDKVVQLFENSLFTGGYLVLGSKETIAWCKSAKSFSVVNVEDKIYKKIG
ncbi:MAG: chemotaxis protein CheR [Bacteroidetes bacterium GWE2_29_8]|nr:MAG: chemotaxis protein CheR [Bacteroidetes bacterium GWE2_29_8]OFY20092.1 MAG: chemotaxis protein CheR [Bacteroidetes bacterium GWF2_29_10]